MPQAPFPALILASTSRYRKSLLERLSLPFTCVAPETDETPLPDEDARALALRLAGAKAAAVSALHPEALVIGSDQVAAGPDGPVGKPGTASRARAQLAEFRGLSVHFYTAISVRCGARDLSSDHVEPFEVLFRDNSPADIEAYIARERPLDCAGSFKCEGLGIALFRALRGDDPTALEGLPLISLSRILREMGVDPITGSGVVAPR